MIRTVQRDAMRLSVLLALTGCTGLDRAELSEFHAVAADRFQYRATTSYFYVLDSDSWAEGERLRWLQTHLNLYAMCNTGYELTSRRTSFRYVSPLGYPVSNIVYEGRCTP
jgi:hypothetical protein